VTQNQFGSIKEEAEVQLKSYLQEFDRNDARLVGNLFQLLENKNLYKVEEEQKYQESSENMECIICFQPIVSDKHSGLACGHRTFHATCLNQSLAVKAECPICRREVAPAVELPALTRKAIIDFLIKFECSVRSEQTQSFDLVEKLINEG